MGQDELSKLLVMGGRKLVDSTSLKGSNSKDTGTQDQMGKHGMRLGMKGRSGSMKEAFYTGKVKCCRLALAFLIFIINVVRG